MTMTNTNKSHMQVMEEICTEVNGALRYNAAGRRCVVVTVNGNVYWVDYYPGRKPPYVLRIKSRDGIWQGYDYTLRKALVNAITNGRRIKS